MEFHANKGTKINIYSLAVISNFVLSTVELEGQIQDLQEANESAVMKLERAERKIAELEKQNRALASSSDISLINDKVTVRTCVRRHKDIIFCNIVK